MGKQIQTKVQTDTQTNRHTDGEIFTGSSHRWFKYCKNNVFREGEKPI